MEKTLLKVLTDQWIFETDLTLEEAKKAVFSAKVSEDKLLALPLNWATALLNIDGENHPVINDKTTFLDLNEIKVVWYVENTYKAIEKKENEEETEI